MGDSTDPSKLSAKIYIRSPENGDSPSPIVQQKEQRRQEEQRRLEEGSSVTRSPQEQAREPRKVTSDNRAVSSPVHSDSRSSLNPSSNSDTETLLGSDDGREEEVVDFQLQRRVVQAHNRRDSAKTELEAVQAKLKAAEQELVDAIEANRRAKAEDAEERRRRRAQGLKEQDEGMIGGDAGQGLIGGRPTRSRPFHLLIPLVSSSRRRRSSSRWWGKGAREK